MTDTRMLKKRIEESGFKISFIAKKLGLSSYGFALKRDNKSEFTASEINSLCNLLHIDAEGMMDIFFAEKVE